MHLDVFSQHDSPVHRLDPRGRLLSALAVSVLLALSRSPAVCGAGLILAIVAAFGARLPLGAALRRLGALNAVMLMLVVLLPWGTAGAPLLEFGPLVYGAAGLAKAGLIALKGNAILLLYTALVSTIAPPTLGHALTHLGAPQKLTTLWVLTVRYVGTTEREYQRLRTAMRARGFRPGTNRHTLSTFGRLAGILLVRSFDRSERVLGAMKLRGWRGRFWILHHFHFRRRDGLFALVSLVSLVSLVLLGWSEWLLRTTS